ncbi:TPA: helix-turn-helix transcriptional regulator [Enterobacter cloacae]|nr:helix-turn-helix transcriptional regulator [Enterobacter cloacae]
MTPFIPNAGYQVIVLSSNAFLWLGLHSIVSTAVSPRPEAYWINNVTPEGLQRLQELFSTNVGQSWLLFTDTARVNDINTLPGNERIRVVPGNVSLAQLSHCFSDMAFSLENTATLTYQEMRVCRLIQKGFSPVRIAQILNKSPKTIYTHKRNAMKKFCCQNLAEFYRKLCLLDALATSL